ncbi:MAG TPA: acyl-protein synthetase [Gemmatimonas aurantiaca]|uniref:Acyl-protein synthetase n=1 Tax=Gemmatimonas aurantiaca TaxID=173480 RepID=A0A3D4V3X3_9BACT|nr:acyl-protein synthetase [Gemmatimonas aurantiaca]HCT55803.1 acyl-protein synthetase [Gemmatimonas aurantiaca]
MIAEPVLVEPVLAESVIAESVIAASDHATALADLLAVPQYTHPQETKSERLRAELAALTSHHRACSEPYARMVNALFPHVQHGISSLADVPWVPVGLFKSHQLQSIADTDIATVLVSSGTSGQQPSRIVLDREAAAQQRTALASIMGTLLGPKRLPMLVIDTPSIIKGRGALSARGAGVLGMMTFGAAHAFALDDTLVPQPEIIARFLERHGHAPFLMFGFTFLAWQALVEQMPAGSMDLSQGILVHSGGWKKLIERSVSDVVFKDRLREQTGLARVHNFYGMVEQIGGVFLEGDDGLLYPPDFADVIVRDPRTLDVVPHGTEGVIQVLSLLPRSYPGHSILTEDRGVIVHEDAPGASRRGKGFVVLGRVPRAELRGCSDVIATTAAASL